MILRPAGLCFLGLALSLAPPSHAQDAAATELELLRSENHALRQQVEALNAQVRVLQARLDALQEPTPSPETPAPPSAAPATSPDAAAPPPDPDPGIDPDQVETLRDRVAELEAANDQLTDRARLLRQEGETLRQLAGVATDQDVVAQQDARLRERYDKRADRSTLTFGPEPLSAHGSPGNFFVSVVAGQRGPLPLAAGGEPVEVSLFIQTDRADAVFGDREAVRFEFDGRPLDLPITGYDVSRIRTGLAGKNATKRFSETVTLRTDPGTLARLGEARTLAVTAGHVTLTFERDARAGLRAVSARLNHAE
ncbi:MAG: hypothetical protein AAFX76_10575 [Planctomycetota bacterium]